MSLTGSTKTSRVHARGTVKVHLSHIVAKLGASTRAELAAEATRRETVAS
jgi:DNA-binding CsgD family transcriptional regulator